MERGDPPRGDVVDHDPDADAESMSTRVVRTVAVATDTAPEKLPPLHDAVDPEALNKLYDSATRGGCSLSFSYAETDVFIDETGKIHVHPADDSRGEATE